jgi:MFS transporter, DHA1 family, multidrug resistance protein
MTWKRNFYAIFAAEFLAIAGFGALGPILPFYIQDLGITGDSAVKLWVGLVQTGGAVSMAFFAPIWGRLADCYGRRIMFLRSLVGGTIMMFCMGLATHPWQILLFRTAGGAFTGTVAAATVLVAGSAPPALAGYTLGMLQMGIMVGNAVGPTIGGVLADLFGYRVSFMGTSVLLAAGALIVLLFVHEEFEPRRPEGPFWRHLLPDFAVLGRSREVPLVLAVVVTLNLSGGAVSPILPLFLQSLTPNAALLGTTSGLIIGGGALASALAAAGAGRFADRLGYQRVLVGCLAGGVITHLLLIAVRTTPQLALLRLLTGIVLGGAVPTVNALLATRVDRAQLGTIYGLSTSISATANAVGPALGAGICALWGFVPVFAAVALILASGAVLVFLASKAARVPGRAG